MICLVQPRGQGSVCPLLSHLLHPFFLPHPALIHLHQSFFFQNLSWVVARWPCTASRHRRLPRGPPHTLSPAVQCPRAQLVSVGAAGCSWTAAGSRSTCCQRAAWASPGTTASSQSGLDCSVHLVWAVLLHVVGFN